MSESQLRDRVQEILTEADASSGSIVADSETGDDDSAESDLLETATEANDLLESTDPEELLEAVGLDTLEDGSEPGSIPEAIARGNQENVEDLQRLLRLSRLADRADDGGLEGAVDDLRAAIGEQAGSDGDASDAERDDRDESAADEGSEESPTGGDGADTANADDGNAETTDDLGDRLRSAMSDSFAEFGDEVSQLKARLEERSAGSADSEAAADADADDAADDAADREPDEADAADEDEGLLGSGPGGDQERGTASGGPSRHSTMAPPPSKRRDMRGTARHSTMPDKYG